MGLIELKDIKKVYSNKNYNTFALNGINLTINKGEIIAVMGRRSGSGKSTLLNVIGLIDIPNAGEYTLNGKSLTEIRANKVIKQEMK
ncbi:ATP-binding cassette domain-containing protein, partial [Bacillus pacificus]|nr:ATP-binding cassette domain-containing protein [Bacillus pacificus]